MNKIILSFVILIISGFYPVLAKDNDKNIINEIKKWMLSPSEEDPTKLLKEFENLDAQELREVIKLANELPFEGRLILSGFVAKNDNFEDVVYLVNRDGTDIEKAVTLVAAKEYNAKNGWGLSQIETSRAAKIVNNKDDKEAGELVAITLASSDYYSVEVFSALLRVLKKDFKDTALNNEIKNMYLKSLEKITDTNTNHIKTKEEKIAHFERWLENNKDKLKPSTEERGENLVYKNYLHEFSLTMPVYFQRIFESDKIRGKCCYFADSEDRSISVSTFPKSETDNLEDIFNKMNEKSIATKTKDLSINGNKAFEYELKVPQGHLFGLIIEMDKRFILVNAYTPYSEDDISIIRNLLNGVSTL